METSALTPDKIIEFEGGMITSNSGLVARSAAAKPTGWLCLMWAGIKTTPVTPTANAVATDKPYTAAKIMQVSTQVKGKPPCTPPTMFLANSTKRREIAPVSIQLPASMKDGMAASRNLLMFENISRTEISLLALPTCLRNIEAKPICTATDTVSAKHITVVQIITMRGVLCGKSCPH